MVIGPNYRRQQCPKQSVWGDHCATMDNVYAIQVVYLYYTMHYVRTIHLLVADDDESVHWSWLHLGMQSCRLRVIQPG